MIFPHKCIIILYSVVSRWCLNKSNCGTCIIEKSPDNFEPEHTELLHTYNIIHYTGYLRQNYPEPFIPRNVIITYYYTYIQDIHKREACTMIRETIGLFLLTSTLYIRKYYPYVIQSVLSIMMIMNIYPFTN